MIKGDLSVSNVMRNWFLLIWNFLDPIYYSFTRLTYIQDERQQNMIFRVRMTKYKGGEVTLSDGTTIKKNDKLIKIHLHNAKLLKELHPVTCDISRGKFIFKKVLESLPALANYLDNHPNRDELKGIIGITTLHRGCNRLGFETYEIKSFAYKVFKLITFLSITFLSSTTLSRRSIQKQQPKYLFMSTESLRSRYKVN
jgi:hypothetical protein